MKVSFGANELPASSSFNQRKEYIKNYPAGITDIRSIDYWYEDFLYGKVSSGGDVIYPSEAFLKQLPGGGDETHFALNFVVDAYEGFRREMQRQENNDNFINLDGTPFESKFQPTKGWANTNGIYNDYMGSFYENVLLPFMKEPGRNQDIVDFNGFVEEFTQLIDGATGIVPFTKTEYIASKYMPPLGSGLVVEFSADYLHGDDFPKIIDFTNNINFELYRTIARRHGFALDKNAPWRLICNVNSSATQSYMKKYDIGFENLFDKYYYKSHFFDIPNMKSYLFQFYQNFIQSFPDVVVPALENVKGKNISLTKKVPRATMTRQQYKEDFENLFWIRLYVYVRAKETNRDWDQHKFDQTVKKASDFFIYSGETAMFKFVNKEVKREPGEYFQTDEYRKGSFRFKRKRG